MNRAVALLAAALAACALLAGCGKPRSEVRVAASGPACVTNASGPAPSGALAGLELACLDSGRPVALGRIGAPAVVNLWASWCAPCRQELPAFQRYSERTGSRLDVVGVATRDETAAARSLAADLHLTFPMLADPDGRLLAVIGRTALPATVFLDARGQITYVYNAQALDEPTLEQLVERYLGVVVR